MSDLITELLEASISNADPSDEGTFVHRWKWLIEQHDKEKNAEIKRLRSENKWLCERMVELETKCSKLLAEK